MQGAQVEQESSELLERHTTLSPPPPVIIRQPPWGGPPDDLNKDHCTTYDTRYRMSDRPRTDVTATRAVHHNLGSTSIEAC